MNNSCKIRHCVIGINCLCIVLILAGRSSEIELYPFSFSEYCEMKGVDRSSRTTKGIAGLRNCFDEYMKTGGFPELMAVKNGRTYISNLVDNILKRDIEQRYNISYPA